MKRYTAQEKKEYYAQQKQEIEKALLEGVQAVYTSDRFTEYLDMMMKFHKYSINNCMLIVMQKPDATMIAGCNDWNKKFNRTIIKGEKAIRILAPIQCKMTVKKVDEDGQEIEETIHYNRFKWVPVFDVSQTTGKDLPELCTELKDNVADYERILEALKAVSPVPVSFEDMEGMNGYFSRAEQRIAVRVGMSEAMTLKTLSHEIAHSLLHNEKDEKNLPPRHIREVQAESVAYMVCKGIGFDTGDYSFEYVAGWQNEKQQDLVTYMTSIRDTADKIISSLS